MNQETNKTQEPNIIFVSMSQTELPKFREDGRKSWVSYGQDNDFPERLLELSRRSALHGAILSSKANDAVGEGVSREGRTPEELAFFDAPNPEYDIDELILRCAWDLAIFGGFILNPVTSKDGRKVAELWHADWSRFRSGVKDEDGRVNQLWYSKDWKRLSDKKYAPIPYETWKADGAKGGFVRQYSLYTPGVDYYPLPGYTAALATIETDAEIANFSLASIRNGMAPSILINFPNGLPSPEEERAIEKKVRQKYQGSDSAGKFIITFSEGADKAPTVTTIAASDLDKQFIQLKETVMQGILSGHGVVSPLLVGIPSPVGLGGTSIVKEAWQLYESRVVLPLRKKVERAVNEYMKYNGWRPISITSSSPVEFSYSEGVLQNVLTVDEMRENIGYPPKASQNSPDTIVDENKQQ